jgi:ParB family transcriptional regulator, chromosome partitioning protein
MSKVKGGLGKGLAALIRPAADADKPKAQKEIPQVQTVLRETEGVSLIELSKIKPNPFQPRADFDEVALDELKKSILEKGIIQPVTVRRKGEEYELIAGERRVRASVEAKLLEIPAYIIDVKTDEEMLELALIENLQREYLNPIEIAISYQRLVTECHQTYEEVAQRIGKDRTTIINFLRLLKLPPSIQQSLRKGELTAGHARALLSLNDEKHQMKIFQKIIKTGLNVRQVEKLVRDSIKKPVDGKFKVQVSDHADFSDLEEKLRQIFGTKVKISSKGEGKGEVVIDYYSILDLERLIELFMIIKSHS